MHPKASHVCYAYRIGMQIQRDIMGQVVTHSERDYSQDDGEPSGTAGRSILQVLQ
ncbi:MAG: YigZ family protein [Candidatus Peribacteria bacterium]|nr:MAG: YigZ family protein [Candidatus Peribacteria bacterium]